MNKLIAAFLLLGCGSLQAIAATTQITGYDINHSIYSGFGNWGHYYTGSIDTSYGPGNQPYSGGTGTLADGVIGDAQSSHLFQLGSYDVAITLYLDDIYELTSIDLFGGNHGNSVPGAINSADITINGETINLLSIEFGGYATFGSSNLTSPNQRNDKFDLIAAGFSDLYSDEIVISNISVHWEGSPDFDYYSISEIQVSAVPIPATLWLFGSGLGLLGWMRRKPA